MTPKFNIEYPYHSYNTFVDDMQKAGFEVRHYEGRFFFSGPAVVVSTLQEAFSKTEIPCQWDNMGLQYIVYPAGER